MSSIKKQQAFGEVSVRQRRVETSPNGSNGRLKGRQWFAILEVHRVSMAMLIRSPKALMRQ